MGIYILKIHHSNKIWITWFHKDLAKPYSQIPNIYFAKINNEFKVIYVVLIQKYISVRLLLSFHDSFWKYIVLYADIWSSAFSIVFLHRKLYDNSRQNVIILLAII